MRLAPDRDVARPPDRRRTTLRVLAVAAVAAAAWFLVYSVVYPPWHDFFDLRVYRGGVDWWLDGKPLYAFRLPHSRYGYTYPPFAALLMTPLAVVSQPAAVILVLIASGLVVVAGTWWLVAPVARRAGWTPWFAVGLVLPVVVLTEPVRDTLGLGQVNLFIAALVFADVIGLRRGCRWAGVGIGLAAAVKLTPAIFVLYLLLTRRWRSAAVAAGTFLVATAGAFAVAPGTSLQYWGSAVWETSRVGDLESPHDHSLLGALARVAYPAAASRPVWLFLAGGVLAVGMWRAVRAFRAGDEIVGIALTGLTGGLVSPITWGHHLVWIVPGIVVLLDVAGGAPLHEGTTPFLRAHGPAVARAAGAGALAVAVVFCSSLPWYFKPPDDGAPPRGDLAGLIGQDSYVLVVLALLVLLPIRAPVSSPDRQPTDPIGSSRLSSARGGGRTTARPRPGGWSPR
jgi:alpha-1,2-mannosyltransferase